MTLTEMKKKVLKLIEEINSSSQYLTDDPDIAAKINEVINQVQNELARIKKITAREEIVVDTEEQDEYDFKDIDKNMFQLNIIRGVEYSVIGETIIFNESGTAKIFYYKYPKQITEDVDADKFKFDLSTDALEIMPYGVAADLLKSDISAQYGRVYAERYEQMLQRLDPRYHTGSIYIDGGDADEFI